MSKPDVVEVIRFYRPLTETIYGDTIIDSNRGVTAIFNLDYKNKTGTATVSVCNYSGKGEKDVFCKKTGVEIARTKGVTFDILLPDEENSLFYRLCDAVAEVSFNGDKNSKQFIRVLTPQLFESQQFSDYAWARTLY